MDRKGTGSADDTDRAARPMGTGAAVGVTVAVLAVANVVNNRWAPSFGVLTGVVVSALLLGVLFRAGGGWADAGLGAATLRSGALWAVVLVGLVAAGYATAALLPVTRGLFADERYGGLTGGQVALRVLVTVPVGTVLLEEVAFRGVLYGLVLRVRGAVWATAVSSVLFGVWHVLPSLGLATDKPALTPLFGRSAFGVVAAVVAAVLFTGAAGVLFCELRRRSGSLLAPMGLHWAVNAFGYLVGFLLR
ncbi:CPBP family intramembrane glutamic endopeptidase [Streptomyces rimosus]|uniref:CPBP family intramembrane glutamic endopeptidase n=1 Tax=Streptomyces rimosus TaxID=1927 RepID=UPI000A7C1B5A|nr:CPBP family intramembrane glutamic endopeptidase [Streptomyces rimosus]